MHVERRMNMNKINQTLTKAYPYYMYIVGWVLFALTASVIGMVVM